jgi:hypothetical protein
VLLQLVVDQPLCLSVCLSIFVRASAAAGHFYCPERKKLQPATPAASEVPHCVRNGAEKFETLFIILVLYCMEGRVQEEWEGNCAKERF